MFKDNAVLLMIATLLVLVISGATGGILAGPMLAGLILIALALFDGKSPKPDVGAVFKGFDCFLNAFLFWIVWGILFLVAALILNYIPYLGKLLSFVFGILLKTLLVFGLFLVADRKMEFWPASMASLNRVTLVFFPLLGFMVVLAILNVLGSMVCGVGLIVTVPITLCCLAVAYRDLFGQAQASA